MRTANFENDTGPVTILSDMSEVRRLSHGLIPVLPGNKFNSALILTS